MPLTVVKNEDGTLSLADTQSMIYPNIFRLGKRGLLNFKWLGWPGIIPDNIEEKTKIIALLAKENCIPIWIEEDTIVKYQLFIDRHLNFMVHNNKSMAAESDCDPNVKELWRSYKEVNSLFVRNLNLIKQEKDMIWVHNFYLLLAPGYIKRSDVNANVGFYFYCPFPNMEVFNTFEFHNEIL